MAMEVPGWGLVDERRPGHTPPPARRSVHPGTTASVRAPQTKSGRRVRVEICDEDVATATGWQVPRGGARQERPATLSDSLCSVRAFDGWGEAHPRWGGGICFTCLPVPVLTSTWNTQSDVRPNLGAPWLCHVDAQN